MSEPDHQTSSGLESVAPARHRGDVDLVAAVRVHGELGLGRRARRREDEGGLVGLHRHVARRSGPRPCRGTRPTSGRGRRSSRASSRPRCEHDDVLDAVPRSSIASSTMPLSGTSLPRRYVTSVVNTSLEPLACDAVGQRLLAEAGEDHRVDRADAHGGEHQHDRLGARGHVDRQPVALADAHAAQRGRDPLDLGEQLRVGEAAAVSPRSLK